MAKEPDTIQSNDTIDMNNTKAELEIEVARLKLQIRHLQMEREALEKAAIFTAFMQPQSRISM